MYIAYGWPKVLPMAPAPQVPSQQQVIYLKAGGGRLLLVSSSHLEVWSTTQHKFRLGVYTRSLISLQTEGHNVQAVWSNDGKTILVLTSAHIIHQYEIVQTDKLLRLDDEKEPSDPTLVRLNCSSAVRAPFADENVTTSNFGMIDNYVALGLSSGYLHLISWSNEFLGSLNLLQELGTSPSSLQRQDSNDMNSSTFSVQTSQSSSASSTTDQTMGFSHLEMSTSLRLLVVVCQDGHVLLCSTSKNEPKKVSEIRFERWLDTYDAVCTSIAHEQCILAVGSRKGTVGLYDLANNASLIRTISLYDWGYSAEDTGAVNCISWTPDDNALAVGWQHRGLSVWSSSGCRLMCTIRQSGLNSVLSPVTKAGQSSFRCEPLAVGVACLAWEEHAYQLYAVEPRGADRITGFSFGKCCLDRGVSDVSHLRQIICGEDRLLIVQLEDDDELSMQHLIVPQSYIRHNWPILHVAASKDGTHLAIAGRHGLILYDMRTKKWRVFGDVMQEQRINCVGLLWLGKIIVVCNFNESSKMFELCFYPRYHLDETSLLCRRQLLDKPIVMDIWQDYILVVYPPFDVHVFHAKLSGKLSPLNTPTLQLVTIRELSIMTSKKKPVSMRFIPHRVADDSKLSPKNMTTQMGAGSMLSQNLSLKQPCRCLILRMGGELSVLDLDEGSERTLTVDIEHFWVSYGHPDGEANLIEEVSWIAYGCNGMQVWYPSSGANSYQIDDFLELDPELEFDREVYPLGLLPYSGVVVGVSQRLSFSAGAEMPCFEPTAQAQTILHCLLRHLLLREKMDEALELAKLSAGRPHFSHSLEWLLFTVFDAVVSSQNNVKMEWMSAVKFNPSNLLEQTCDLIKNFPDYLDVVVSVARKTDGRHWGDLFGAAGKATELFDECFKRRSYRTAACYILVIEKLEGTAVSQYNALRLLQATLEESMYELAGELVRFLLRSGREFDLSNGETERKSNGLFDSFLFRSGIARDSSNKISTKSSFSKEMNSHIATVKKILENHASSLMSRKELRELVAFVKGTQFDLTEFLQSSGGKAAQLQDFASALQVVGQKLDMDVLQSRLDAEFLLAHMCAVGFKEWIVVLATLLRRAEVLLNLFRGDERLWEAYRRTLKSHADFQQFGDLMLMLDEALTVPSTDNS